MGRMPHFSLLPAVLTSEFAQPFMTSPIIGANNTRQLAERCQERGLPAYHVQGVEDLRAEWFEDVEVVGLTAGTSTLDETVDAVESALLHIQQRQTVCA